VLGAPISPYPRLIRRLFISHAPSLGPHHRVVLSYWGTSWGESLVERAALPARNEEKQYLDTPQAWSRRRVRYDYPLLAFSSGHAYTVTSLGHRTGSSKVEGQGLSAAIVRTCADSLQGTSRDQLGPLQQPQTRVSTHSQYIGRLVDDWIVSLVNVERRFGSAAQPLTTGMSVCGAIAAMAPRRL